MDSISKELRIVKITEDLGQGKYISEDVFSQEKIGVILLGKERMYFKLHIEAEIYVLLINSDKGNARFINKWKDPMSFDNAQMSLEKQEKRVRRQIHRTLWN